MKLHAEEKQDKARQGREKLYLLYCAAFVLLCALPSISMLLGYRAENRENRPLARMPALTNRDGGVNLAFPAEFDRYFEDHFGLREEMVTAFHATTMALVSDTRNEKVIVGKEDMLFFSETLDDYMGLNRLTDEEIGRIAASLRLQQEFAAQHGLRFAFAIAPNKSSIYPEYMPGWLVPAGEEGNRERLYKALEEQGIATVDLAGLLAQSKADGLLYHPHDTHWNDKGAILAYQALLPAVLPAGTQMRDCASYTPEWVYDHAGDLHNFVLPALEGKMLRPRYRELEALSSQFAYDPGARPKQDTTFATTAAGEAVESTLYMMRDSFAEALIPLFSTEIRRVVYSSEFPYNYTGVRESNAQGILIELVERNIKNLLHTAPLMPAIMAQAPPIPEARMEARVMQAQRGGLTALHGAFDGGYGAPIYIIIEGKQVYCFEAFPILEEAALALAEGMHEPAGFSLTLPDTVEADTYRVTVVSAGQAGDVGTVEIF